MKAIRVHNYGGPEALALEDVDVPQAGPGEAVVKVGASGVNFIDIYFRTGLYKAPQMPFTPGQEASGTVSSTGPGVTEVRVGDRVAFAMTMGSYAEHVRVQSWKLVKLPDNLDFNQGAAIMLQGCTAHYLSHSTFPLKPGHTALVHAGAGGVGLLLTQIACKLGATVYTTAGSEAKAELSRQAGASEVILYSKQDFESEVRRLTSGRGVDVVYDSVGVSTFAKSLNSLRPRGYMVLFGQSSGPVPPVDAGILNTKGSLFLTRPSLTHYAANRDELLSRTSDLFRWAASGELKIRIGKTFPLAEAAVAQRELEEDAKQQVRSFSFPEEFLLKSEPHSPTFARASSTPERREYSDRLNRENSAALWDVIDNILVSEPRPACMPAIWKYDQIRPLMMEAGSLISAQEAERRVLLLENPGLRGGSRVSQTLFAGIQLVLPGEVAASHRHVASAFRLVLEGSGGYTAVDGEKTTMHPGDFILTPSWTFHDHGNLGNEPIIWMDGLDVPLVHFFDAMFAEHYPGQTQPHTRNEGDALARYGSNLLPVDYKPTRLTAPMSNYPYSRSREALDELYRNGPLHPCHGIKVQYSNPATGGYPIPTLGAFLQLLPAGFSGAPHRSTDESVYCVREGSGSSRVGGSTFSWKLNDIFVVPSWCPVTHTADRDAVLFSFSNRPAQKALGLWREESL